MSYWDCLDKLVNSSQIIIDRPKGGGHPNYKDLIYPIDYGYLKNTTAIDGAGIDVFLGSTGDNKIKGIIATVDLKKRDAEIKIMISCSDDEIKKALKFLNTKSHFQAVYIERES
ncbi:MAG: inorganic pyrophosphatase [Spirochaetes bacterium]|nr:inorganic pyrophosphatase [Spirochaetota bacterium]